MHRAVQLTGYDCVAGIGGVCAPLTRSTHTKCVEDQRVMFLPSPRLEACVQAAGHIAKPLNRA